MTHTVLLDHKGFVVQVWRDTRSASLDERMYSGTLMEADGEVWPGHRWDGQRFVLAPPRVPAEDVAAERQRRIETFFPERFRDQVTVFGGENAMRMHQYVTEVHGVAELMMLDEPPQDYASDHHWPTPPTMEDMPVPVKHHENAPVSVTVAPVINASAPEPKALIVEHRTVSDSVPPVSAGEFGLDRNDPLYELKEVFVGMVEEMVNKHKASIPADLREEWEERLADMAAIATAASSEGQIEAQGRRVDELIGGKAA